MADGIFWIVLWMIILGALGFWAARLAKARGRDPVAWAIAAVLFGIIAVFVVAVLPPVRQGKLIDSLHHDKEQN